VLDVGDAVPVLHPSGHDPEALPPDGVHHGAAVGQEVDAPDGQHAAEVHEAAELRGQGPSGAWTLTLGGT